MSRLGRLDTSHVRAVPAPAADPNGDPEGLVYHPDDIVEHGSAVLLSKDIGNYLEKHYPGWAWAVSADPRGGVFNIRSLKCSGEWGVVLLLEWIQRDPKVAQRYAIAAGGEILERFGIRPGPYSYDAWAAAPRDVSGMLRPDLSDKHAKIRRFQRDQAFSRAVAEGSVQVRTQDTARADGSTHRRIIVSGS
jgi:hypothetical protein